MMVGVLLCLSLAAIGAAVAAISNFLLAVSVVFFCAIAAVVVEVFTLFATPPASLVGMWMVIAIMAVREARPPAGQITPQVVLLVIPQVLSYWHLPSIWLGGAPLFWGTVLNSLAVVMLVALAFSRNHKHRGRHRNRAAARTDTIERLDQTQN
ncbi:hypothetical protein [Microbacterium oleivorans]|uniref:Uncharacterized protein n=1 Tax=Microbacterium oleivorans TaxID=273677 RepID=A0A7D5F487_9MICO|nr:hypothetical protein [Microbacterium oleivorans]QLD11027.1 hypothetical protein HW566_04035 [Microbacterium oleivorans]